MKTHELIGRRVKIAGRSPIYPGLLGTVTQVADNGHSTDCLVSIARPRNQPIYRAFNLAHITVLPKE